MKSSVLKSELAGTWYPGSKPNLVREIDSFLDSVKNVETIPDVIALLLPHAGYRYSGRVAAHGIKQILDRDISRVVVIGPSHRVAMLDVVSVPDVEFVETPLGRIEIDQAVIEKLKHNVSFQSHARAHTDEHSVQIELPLLQHALGEFKLVPIVCGELGESVIQDVADTLAQHIDEETLVVISSDFTHYGRMFGYVPFEEKIAQNLRDLDMGAVRYIEQQDASGFMHYVRETGATICGSCPISILLHMLPEQARVHMLNYDTSGNLTGDWSHCVSYVSAAFSGSWAESSAREKVPMLQLSEQDKQNLLRYARQHIAEKLGRGGTPRLEVTPPMEDVMGAFVTLRKFGELRGCIGELFPRRKLHEVIAEQAVNAAFNDSRFPGLLPEELDEIDLEISALTPPQAIESPVEIEIGQHGIVLRKGIRSAVFLPQVPIEQGWNLKETLSHLARKAGLAFNDWESGCEFQVFEAIVFGEE